MDRRVCYFICASRSEASLLGDPDYLFNQIINPICSELNIRAMRSDHLPTSGSIAQLAIQTTLEADFVAAEVSSLSANVAYEVGARRVSGKPLAAFLHESMMTTPFDSLSDLGYITYKNSEQSGEIAKSAFREFLLSTLPNSFKENSTALRTTGLIGGSPLNEHAINGTPDIPAADRYVSVSDNQSSFDEIRKNISDIRSEFANDHNKRELPVKTLEGVIAELDAFDSQIESNWVSRPAAHNFLETLKYIEAVCSSSKNILIATATIAGLLILIFG